MNYQTGRTAPWRATVLAAVVSLVLTACGVTTSPSPSASTAPSNAPSAQPTSSASDGPLTLPPPEVSSIRIGISNLEANSFVPKYAEVAGLYTKYGLTVEVTPFDGAQRILEAIIGNQIDVASDAPNGTLITRTTEAPLVDVAIMNNKFLDCIFSSAAVATPADVAGKRLAVSQLGGQSHAELIIALQEFGLTDQDVNIVQVGGQGDRVAALEAGSVDVIPADCVLEEDLTGQGMNVLLRLSEVDLDFPGANLALHESFVNENPNTVLAVVAANLEAMQLLYSEEDAVVAALAEWGQLEEADARSALQAFKTIAQRDFRWTQEGYETLRDIGAVTNPEIANVDVTQAYTMEFLDQLEQMGFNEEVGVPE